jgi:hypothetical protein
LHPLELLLTTLSPWAARVAAHTHGDVDPSGGHHGRRARPVSGAGRGSIGSRILEGFVLTLDVKNHRLSFDRPGGSDGLPAMIRGT